MNSQNTMDIPFFHLNDIPSGGDTVFPEESSRHIVSVLRMREGEPLRVVNGKGTMASARIADAHKKHCRIEILDVAVIPDSRKPMTLAVSLLKNPSRFEWMLEKVCEIGVHALVPMICHRTERGHVRMDRLHAIAMSAMLQSRQAWLTEVKEPVTFDQLLAVAVQEDRFIAHCLPNGTKPLRSLHTSGATSLLLIGPEGDFTEREISSALSSGFRAVGLGENRLRTETAGVVAAALICV